MAFCAIPSLEWHAASWSHVRSTSTTRRSTSLGVTMRTMRAPIAVVFTAIALCSALWAATPLIGIAWIAAALLLLWLHRQEPPPDAEVPPLPPAPFPLLVAAIVISAAPLLYLAVTWNQEFPFLGDHNVHLRFAVQSAKFWRIWFLPVAGALVLIARGGVLRSAVVLAVAVGVGSFLAPPQFAVRYPGLLHFLAAPFNFIPWEHPLNGLRLTNTLAVPAWLFVLRPRLVRQPLDGSVLAVAALVVLQKDVLYYLTSAYLEPWMLVLALVAFEILVREGSDGAWRAVLVLGAAAMVKEQAVFLIPFAALPGIARRRTWMAGAAAVLPFTLYYLARRNADVWRGLGFASPSDAFTAERLVAFAERSWQQFGIALPLVVLLLLALGVLAVRKWQVYGALALAAVVQLLFFFLDTTAFTWVAYPRFQLLPLALVATPLFAQRARLPLVLLVALLQVPGLLSLWSETRGRDVHRNFFEHADAPIFFPVEELLRGTHAKQITVLSNIHGVVAGYGVASLPAAYPRLLPGAQWRILPLDSRTLGACRCASSDAAVLGLFVFFNERTGRQVPRQAMQDVALDCVAGLRSSCAALRVVEEEGQLVGALGYR